jgi:hypothetical protein
MPGVQARPLSSPSLRSSPFPLKPGKARLQESEYEDDDDISESIYGSSIIRGNLQLVHAARRKHKEVRSALRVSVVQDLDRFDIKTGQLRAGNSKAGSSLTEGSLRTYSALLAQEKQQRRMMGIREKKPPRPASPRAFYDYQVPRNIARMEAEQHQARNKRVAKINYLRPQSEQSHRKNSWSSEMLQTDAHSIFDNNASRASTANPLSHGAMQVSRVEGKVCVNLSQDEAAQDEHHVVTLSEEESSKPQPDPLLEAERIRDPQYATFCTLEPIFCKPNQQYTSIGARLPFDLALPVGKKVAKAVPNWATVGAKSVIEQTAQEYQAELREQQERDEARAARLFEQREHVRGFLHSQIAKRRELEDVVLGPSHRRLQHTTQSEPAMWVDRTVARMKLEETQREISRAAEEIDAFEQKLPKFYVPPPVHVMEVFNKNEPPILTNKTAFKFQNAAHQAVEEMHSHSKE